MTLTGACANARVLIVCRDPAATEGLTAHVERLGHTVCATADSAPRAVERAAELDPDLALIDIEDDSQAVEAAAGLGARGVPLVCLVGAGDEARLGEIRQAAPAASAVSVAKPLDGDRQLRLGIDDALAQGGARADLRRRVDLLEAVVDNLNEGVLVAGPDGDFLMRNHAITEMFGAGEGPGHLRSAEGYRLFQGDRRTPLALSDSPLPQALQGKLSDDVEVFVRRDGQPEDAGVHLSVTGRPLRDPRGAPLGALALLRNVTRRRDAEDELQRTLRETVAQKGIMDAVMANMTDAVAVFTAKGECVLLNAAARREAGLGPGEMDIRRDILQLDIRHPDGSRFEREEFPAARAIRGETFDRIHMVVHHAAHKPRHVAASGKPLADVGGGHGPGALIVFRNFTEDYHHERELMEAEQKAREAGEKLEEQNRFMEMVFEHLSDAVVATDMQGRLTRVNPAARATVGSSAVAVDPDKWSESYGFFHPDGKTLFPSDKLPLALAIRGRATDDVEVFVRNPAVPDGVYYSVDGRPMHDQDGKQVGALVVCRDVTQRVRARDYLQRAFDRGRLDVLETVLHDIGNAINSVSTGVETIRRECAASELVCRFVALADAVREHEDDWLDWLRDDPQGRELRAFLLLLVQDLGAWVDLLRGTAERSSARVQHIVEIVRTQELLGKQHGGRRLARVASMLDAAVKVLSNQLVARGIRVTVQCDGAPESILVHESQFNQVLVNLLKNAMEAIEERARVTSTRKPVEPRIDVRAGMRDNCLAIEVVDNGIGIAPERRRDIFGAGYTTKPSGSGLGLHGAARFVDDAGGRIDVESEGVGRGAAIRLTLPLDALGEIRGGFFLTEPGPGRRSWIPKR